MINKYDKIKLKKLKNQLDIGFYEYSESKIVFYIKHKNMIRTYYYGCFHFIYCIVEIKLKEIRKNLTKNVIETTNRLFRKHLEYYKNE